MKVCKFGGTSLANADQIRKVLKIIRSDETRHLIVVSAPGKRDPSDQKITDLFIEWHRLFGLHLSTTEVRQVIADRFLEITQELGVQIGINNELAEIDRCISNGASADFAASRGEYLSAKIVAAALGYDFLDAANCIHFDMGGRYQREDDLLREKINGRKVVIPGFYGSSLAGTEIKTFSRGGSDITVLLSREQPMRRSMKIGLTFPVFSWLIHG